MTSVIINGDQTTVRVTGGSARRITLDERTVARIGNAMGVQGPQGVAGQAGGTIQPVAFSYGDAPGVIYTATGAGTLTAVRLVVVTPFNGTAPTIALGTLAQPGAAMATTDNDPMTVAEYEITADLHLDAGETLRITITPDGSTAGAGLIYLTFIQD